MKTSVIIPFFNMNQFLGEAIHSILQQTISSLEIIIVDDGSDENPNEIINQFDANIIYHKQKNQGAAHARNVGIKMASGNILAFLDADDVWLPHKLTKQIELLNKFDMVFTLIEQFSLDEKVNQKLENKKILPGHCASTLCLKKETMQSIGLFPEEYRRGEFIAWFTQMGVKQRTKMTIDEVLAKRRIHKNNSGLSNHQLHQDYLKIIANHLVNKTYVT